MVYAICNVHIHSRRVQDVSRIDSGAQGQLRSRRAKAVSRHSTKPAVRFWKPRKLRSCLGLLVHCAPILLWPAACSISMQFFLSWLCVWGRFVKSRRYGYDSMTTVYRSLPRHIPRGQSSVHVLCPCKAVASVVDSTVEAESRHGVSTHPTRGERLIRAGASLFPLPLALLSM